MAKNEVSTPTPPPQPSTADATQAWADSLPQVYQTQMEYAPLQAAQQVALAQQYAAPMGKAMFEAQQQMFPETTALQEQLAGQASQGMEAGVPDWMREQYQENMRAQLGPNALAGSGADYMSRGLLQQGQDWQNYYRNLGLSVAGRQPLAQPQTPGTTDYMSNFTPTANMNYMGNTYGNYSNAYSSMYGANAQLQGSQNQMMGQMVGGALGGAGSWLGGLAQAAPAAASSLRFKKNIKTWA